VAFVNGLVLFAVRMKAAAFQYGYNWAKFLINVHLDRSIGLVADASIRNCLQCIFHQMQQASAANERYLISLKIPRHLYPASQVSHPTAVSAASTGAIRIGEAHERASSATHSTDASGQTENAPVSASEPHRIEVASRLQIPPSGVNSSPMPYI